MKHADIKPGNALPLSNIPVGSLIHNIELKPGKGGQLVRSAGNSAQLMAKEGDYAQVRLPSGEVRMIRINCKATIGQVGNIEHENIKIGKAGRKRWMGVRPTVRGVVMNPVIILMVVVKVNHLSVDQVQLLLGVNQLLAIRQERRRINQISLLLREEIKSNIIGIGFRS